MPRATTITKELKSINAALDKLRQKKVNALLRPLMTERRKLHARLETIERLIGHAGGKVAAGANGVSTSRTVRAAKKRMRRSADELKKIALGAVEFIKSKGKAGASPAEIKARFGNLVPSPPQFLKKHAGVQLQRKGHVKRPSYFYP